VYILEGMRRGLFHGTSFCGCCIIRLLTVPHNCLQLAHHKEKSTNKQKLNILSTSFQYSVLVVKWTFILKRKLLELWLVKKLQTDVKVCIRG
jgi:hypothetical protein